MHILRHAHGEVSNWCHDELQVGQTLNISRPQGHCVYMAEDLQQPLLMVATGTGLAPIYGILHDALARGHSGPIDLYVEAGSDAECYLHSQLHQLMQLHPQFAYHPLIRPTADDTAFDSEMISRFSKRHPSLRGTKVYLCGSADMIALLNRQCFMAGAGRSDILTEPFSAPLKNN